VEDAEASGAIYRRLRFTFHASTFVFADSGCRNFVHAQRSLEPPAHTMLRYGKDWFGRASSHLCKTQRRRQYATAGTIPKQTPISNLETNRFLPYPKLQDALRILRRRLNRPLTLSEKLLYTHLRNPLEQELERGKSFLLLDPDRAACHDATATMAMLQFISAGLPRTMLPTSIHSDHLIVAENGAVADLANAKDDYAEVSPGHILC
jgi:hypothetical protein